MASKYALDWCKKTQSRFLECGVCTEIYNEDDRVPRQLPCFHTFCSACLKIICSERNNIECSLCKASHNVNNQGPENFGKDNTRRDLLLFLRENASENGLQLCGKCSDIITEWFNCDTCSIILCSECKVFHEEKYSNHCLRNTSAVQAEDEDEFEGRCELAGHGNGPLKYYCVSTTCQVGVCSTCIVELHRDRKYHQLKDMTVFIQEKKDALQSDIILLTDKIFTAYILIAKSNSNMDIFMIKKEMLKIKIDDLYEAGLTEPESNRHKLVRKYGHIFQELDELRSNAIENLKKFIKDAEYSVLYLEQILDQKSMITLLNISQSETNQLHDLIALDLNVFEDKSAFKAIENNVTMLEQNIDNLKTLQGNIDQGCNSRQSLIQRILPHIHITNIMQNLRQGLDRGMQNIRQGLDRGMQNLRQELDRGRQNLHQRLDRGRQNIRQGLDRGRQNLRQGLDRGRQILHQGLDRVRQNLRQGLDRVRQNLRQGLDRGMQNIRQGLDRGRQNLRQELDRGRQNLHQRLDRGRQNLYQRLDRGRQNLHQRLDRGRQTLRQVLDRGRQNLRQELDRGRQNLRQGLDRGMQNLRRQGRDRAQMIIKSMYNTIVQPMEQIPWKVTINVLVMAVILYLLISQLRAYYFLNRIKLMTYQFDTSKPSHFACSSFDHMVVSTMPLSAGVYRCGPGKFAHWGVFGNKSFAVEEKAKFVLTLTYQEHDFYVQDNPVEIELLFEFGFTLNTIVENYLYRKENVWAISGYKCRNRYDVCLILTYQNQSHQSLWLGHEDSVFTKNINSGTVMGRLTFILNRKTQTLSILTKSQTFHFDLIDDKQLNGNVWPVFLIHEINGVLPLSAKIGKTSRFSYDPSSLPPNYFLSENNNTVSNIESTNTKYVNNKTRYVYTMPETFQPNVKNVYSRFRIIFNKDHAVKVGQKLFEFGFGIVENKRFKSLMKIKCKTCLTNDGANIGYCLENSLASVSKETLYENVDLQWDIFVYFDLNANELNVLTFPCDTCSYYHQAVSLGYKMYYNPPRFYFVRYNTPMMTVVSNLTITDVNVNWMDIIIFKEKIAKLYWSLRNKLRTP